MYQESDEQQMMPQMFSFEKRDAIKLSLNPTAQKLATQISNTSTQTCQFNSHLDPFNKAEQVQCLYDINHDVEFEHYFLKYKFRDSRLKVFDMIRDLLLQRGYNEISMIRDREEEQVMVVRVVEKVEGSISVVMIEDQFSKDKLEVKEGILWVGMICAIKAKWIQGKYKLQKIIDLSTPIPQVKAHLTANMTANRIMLLKGPFRARFNNQDSGIRIVTNQILKLQRQNIRINQLIIMGPILAKNNRDVENYTLARTYQQQYEKILSELQSEVSKINSNIQIFVMPSLDDIVSMHPIPQPAYTAERKNEKIKHISNPCRLKLQLRRSTCNLSLINYDILKAIQSHKVGKATKQLRQQIMQTYMKQPFFLTNTISSQDPFDEVNLGQLFNDGNFGDIVVFSSTISPPFVNFVDNRLIVNIGGLGVDYHYTDKNFISLISLYEGDGPMAQRVKVQTISHGWTK